MMSKPDDRTQSTVKPPKVSLIGSSLRPPTIQPRKRLTADEHRQMDEHMQDFDDIGTGSMQRKRHDGAE